MIIGNNRPDGALLAGVCAGIARSFKWNVWVLRALFVGFLVIKSVAAVLVYLGIALLQSIYNGKGSSDKRTGLGSPELADRDARIAELDRRFKELEEKDR